MSQYSQFPLFEQTPPITRRRVCGASRKPNEPSSEATVEARQLAFEKIQRSRSKRTRWILETLSERPQTANEVKRRLIELGILPPNAERNAVSPRTSELAKAGCIEALPDLRTVGDDAPASVWAINRRGIELLEHLRREQAERGKARQ